MNDLITGDTASRFALAQYISFELRAQKIQLVEPLYGLEMPLFFQLKLLFNIT